MEFYIGEYAAWQQKSEQHKLDDIRKSSQMKQIQRMVKSSGDHICWLCGEPIDMQNRTRDARSWTLDHVRPLVPKDGGPAPDPFDMSNLREAHRGCNSRKGNTLLGKRVQPDGKKFVKKTRVW